MHTSDSLLLVHARGAAVQPPDDHVRWPLRKRWTYVGVFTDTLDVCAGDVHVGPARQQFVAVHTGGRLRERTVRRPGLVRVSPARVLGGGLDLHLTPVGEPVAVLTPVGGAWTWTRKTPVRAVGTADGRPVDGPGLVDETDGHHPRRTDWLWSAGAGTTDDGRPAAWNLCRGVNDLEPFTESTLWVDGVPRQVPVPDFDGLAGVDGLRFTAEAERARTEDLRIVRSSYRQPFGTFTDELAGVPLTGRGVMEQHAATW